MAEAVVIVGPPGPAVERCAAAWQAAGHPVVETPSAADPAAFATWLTGVLRAHGAVAALVIVGPPPLGAPTLTSAATLGRQLAHVVGGALVAVHQVLPGMQARGAGRLHFVAEGDDTVAAALRGLAAELAADPGLGPVQVATTSSP